MFLDCDTIDQVTLLPQRSPKLYLCLFDVIETRKTMTEDALFEDEDENQVKAHLKRLLHLLFVLLCRLLKGSTTTRLCYNLSCSVV